MDSIVLIGYSVAGFSAKRFPEDTSISLNIVWAAVLAIPEEMYVFFSLSFFYILLNIFHLATGRPSTLHSPKFLFHDDPEIEMLGSLIPIKND